MKKTKGFALILMLSLIPVMTSGILLTFATLMVLEADLALKYSCRLTGLQGQKKVAPLLKNLLHLNKNALQLRIMETQALQQLAMNPNPAAKIAAELRLQKIRAKQEVLDVQQKEIIKHGNAILLSAFELTQQKLKIISTQNQSILLRFQLLSLDGRAPLLAVHPTMVGLAPTYGPLPTFEEDQALAHSWQYQVTVARPFSKFLHGDFKINKSCAVTLKKEGESWIPQIAKAKFLSKSAW